GRHAGNAILEERIGPPGGQPHRPGDQPAVWLHHPQVLSGSGKGQPAPGPSPLQRQPGQSSLSGQGAGILVPLLVREGLSGQARAPATGYCISANTVSSV